ncbi:MAG: glycerol-3-phosphate acyltransferase [Chloroflexota bacterium]
MIYLNYVIFPVIGYIAGSLSFAIWIVRALKGIDLRNVGSGHAGATNVGRHAGWSWGVIVLILDILKGYLPVYFAMRFDIPDWVNAATAALTVIGHCWPLWADFRGGMGLATMGGTLLAVSPLYFLIALGLLIFLTLVMHHAARASVFTGVLIVPMLWLLNQRGIILWIASGTGLVIAIRFYLEDWNREYRELWLDRKKS